MQNKTYEQMYADFKEFYFKKIRPNLPKYEKERKECFLKIVAFRMTFFFLLAGAFLAILSEMFHFLGQISVLILAIAGGSAIWLTYLFKDKNNIVLVKSDFDKNLKSILMRDFLGIFSQNTGWHNVFMSKVNKKTDIYRKSNIFNPFLFAVFDDNIYIDFKNIKIDIYEVNTSIFDNHKEIFLPLFLVFLIAFIPTGFVLLLILCSLFPFISYIVVPILIIITIFVIKKCIQYAPFKGIVVELNMNKNFKGHTFFLNKSINSKKIKIDRNKYENVKLESPSFMNKYDVFSTNQIEARYLLTTAMIDRLDHLNLAFKANYIRGSFKDDKLILAIDTGKNMFAMGDDFKESNLQTFVELFNEIVSIMKIVDQLKLDENTRL